MFLLQKACRNTGGLTVAPGALLALQLLPKSTETSGLGNKRGQGVIGLSGDIVVKTNGMLFLNGGGATLHMRSYQFKVEGEARICMYNLNLKNDGESAPLVRLLWTPILRRGHSNK